MVRNSAKRQRSASSAEQHDTDILHKHKLFTDWARQQDVEIHGVQPQSIEGRGLGLVTTQSIQKGDRILFVPEEAIFKPDFNALRKKNLERASSQAKLTLSALFHFASSKSSLKLWLHTWPTRADLKTCMPMCWNAAVQDRLPLATKSVLDRQLADYRKDWLTCQNAVTRVGYSEDDFMYYWMIVNSRSFHWAPPRGGAGYMIMCPFIDYTNHCPTGHGCEVIQRSDGFDMLAQRDYEEGEEIFISYGAHCNDKLLVHYGFTLAGTGLGSIDDEVRIDEAILPSLPDHVKQQLADVGYLGPFALVPRATTDNDFDGCEPCFKTQVALRATILTCNEWEYFAASGEDLSGDKTPAISELLIHALDSLCTKAKKNLTQSDDDTPSDMTKKDYATACLTIKARWAAAIEAIEGFGKQHRSES